MKLIFRKANKRQTYRQLQLNHVRTGNHLIAALSLWATPLQDQCLKSRHQIQEDKSKTTFCTRIKTIMHLSY